MHRPLFYTLCVLFAVTAASAEDTAQPPQKGEKAGDFELRSPDGKTVRLSDHLRAGPVVVVMLRGYPGYQCPLCTRQVGSLIKAAPEFAEHNAHVLLVYPGPADGLDERAREFLKDVTLPKSIKLVTDPDYGLTSAWGLRWDAPRETAYPSTFVMGTDGVVAFAKVSRTHGGRARTRDVVSAVADTAN